ncbi:chaperonin 10-like protein [Xylariales sp. PMI_506]|nr:chaperonin 10-like protein [Xylariales sp. PMI_506]
MPSVKSWIYTTAGYPETLQQATTSAPAVPAPHHILVQVKASAINPVDVQMMNMGLNSIPGLSGTKIVGKDFAGVVLAAAPGTGWVPGDEVMGVTMALDGSGTLTEVAHLGLGSTAAVTRKPEHLSWDEAASLPLVWLTAYTTIERCAPFMKEKKAEGEGSSSSSSGSPAPKLVVLGGSSATGIYTIWLARQRGWTVLASCSGRNAEFVRARGAHEIVDYTTGPDSVPAAVAAFAPDAIADCVGGTECIGLAPQYVTIVGDKTSRSTMGGTVLYLFYPRMLLRWLLGWLGLGKSYECIILDPNEAWLADAAKLPKEDVIIDSVFPFEEVPQAFERLNTGRAKGKVVVSLG